MDLTNILETIVSNLPPNATININVAQPGAPIYNCFGGAQFIGNNPAATSSRKKKSNNEETTESADSIKINLDDSDEETNEIPFDEDIVMSQSGEEKVEEQQESVLNTDSDGINLEELIADIVENKDFNPTDVPSLRTWAVNNLDAFADAVTLAEDEWEAEEGVNDIYTTLENVGWSK